MPREAGIEQYGVDRFRQLGWWAPKLGREGWPDRLVVFAAGRHFWWEVKQPDGSFTAAQRVRIPMMQKSGEAVFSFDSRAEIDDFVRIMT